MDRRGILRGKCLLEHCDCSQYELPADSETHLCSYCEDSPTKHLKVQTAESEKDDKEPEAQQSAQGEPVSGTSGVEYKRQPPTTSQQDQSAKKKPKKSNNENEGDVSTIPQASDESAQQSAQIEPVRGTSGVGYKRPPPTTSQQDQSAKKKPKKSNNENEGDVSTMLEESDESAQQSESVSGTSGMEFKRPPPTTFQQDQSAKKKPKKSNNENEGNVSTIPQESDLFMHLAFTDKAEGLSKEENNYIRLYYTSLKIATQAVRLIFDREVSEHKLESFLREHRPILTSKKSNCRCTKQQESILFPGGHVVVVSADFDFTLLYKLIRNLLTAIPPPTFGWGKEPLPEHLNETDDIERIRSFRNGLSHNTKLQICDADFSTHWTDLSQAIYRLSKGSLSTDVESMRTKIFDKCIKNKMEEDIQKEQEQMCKDIIELQQQVDANKQDIVDIKQNIVDNEQEIHNGSTFLIELNTQSNLPMLSEKGLMYVASKLGFDWHQVALILDITQAELEQMQMNYPCQVVKQITVALIRWRNRQRNRPQKDTIKQLIGALEVAERQDIIDDLREKYGTD